MQNNLLTSNKLCIYKSQGRVFNEKASLVRTPFQRDRDRIIHSASFRRLKHKTQVFANTEEDHFRTRLTHSMEVSQIARTIARTLVLNEDLSETLSLSHDLGHTPFGHSGEESLNECMDDYGGFDHNIQTIRIVTLIEKKYYDFRGLNLTLETLDGLLKHNGPIYDLSKIEKILQINILKNKIKFHNSPSLEAQVAAISDDIAYNNHDIQDGIRAGLFTIEELSEINFFKELLKKHKNKIKKHGKEIVIYQIIRDSINIMANDLTTNTRKNLTKFKIKKKEDVYNKSKKIVNFSNRMEKNDFQIKEFLGNKMYNERNVVKMNNFGKKIIKKLFEKIQNNPKKFIKEEHLERNDKNRSIADFVAGMTDRYAINLYNSLK